MSRTAVLSVCFLSISLTAVAAEHNPLLPRPQKVQYRPGKRAIKTLKICLGAAPSDEDRFAARELAAILAAGNLTINRFFALDTRAYEAGALPAKTKELLGLVASMVLRCDDCVTYHVVRCREEGVTDPEFYDAFAVALVVGGSIVIPHLRRAAARLEELPAR